MKKLLGLVLGLSMIAFTPTVGNAKDVSSEIKANDAGKILGCTTRLKIYALKSQNVFDETSFYFVFAIVGLR